MRPDTSFACPARPHRTRSLTGLDPASPNKDGFICISNAKMKMKCVTVFKTVI